MKFAVARMDLFDNELLIEIIDASNWRDALLKHSCFVSIMKDHPEYLDTIPEDLESAKGYFFDGDIFIDVVQVPE